MTRRFATSARFNRRLGQGWLGGGYLFLYLPIASLVLYSFNDSPMAGAWAGFTLRWYAELAQDRELLAGLWLSLQIAFCTACGSVLLGTLAAFALVRYGRFRGRTLFAGMVSAPLVMPEVIVGLSLLLMLVSLQRVAGFPERGMLTIWLGHLLLGIAYATVVVQARLREMPVQLEEAAMDLGARPHQVFRLVTLPMIAQSLVSAWLLTFTLSFDDVVISEFLSGPGVTTLPQVIFSYARRGVNPSIYAAATILITVVSLGIISYSIYVMRRQKRLDREISAAARPEQAFPDPVPAK